MNTFDKLGIIADAYNPALLIVLFFHIINAAYQKNWLKTELLLSSSILGIGFVYLVMFIDKKLSVWYGLGLDYSTHTALSVCLVFILIRITKQYSKTLIISLMTYFLLMLYQQYHSLMDILTTFVVILLMLSTAMHLRKRSLHKLWG